MCSSSYSGGEGAARGTTTVELPQLTKLLLYKLPNLTAWCRSAAPISAHTTEILGTLRVDPNIEVLFEPEKVNDVENATNTILPCLEQLHLLHLPKLKKVWKNGAQACQGFQSLKIFDVSECESMEHIVGKGEEDNEGAMAQTVNAVFPQLAKLRLKNLPNLTGFLNGMEYTIGWMSMKELFLEDCPNMTTFSSVSMMDCRGTVPHHPLFNKDASLVKLDKLQIKNVDCEIIWHTETRAAVEELIVSDCHKLNNVLSSSCDGIKVVKYLEVSKCDSLDSVFQFDCEQEIDAAALLSNGLKGLRLCDLPKLTHICNMGIGHLDHHPYHVIIEAVLTKHLTALCLHNCPSLQRVFSLSNTTRSVPFPKLMGLHNES